MNEEMKNLTEETIENTTEAVVEKEETMDDYKEELESSLMRIRVGDVVNGTVIAVTEQEVLVNFGYISDGIVPLSEALADTDTPLAEQFAVGAEVKAEIIKKDDGEGNVVLSFKKAIRELAWDKVAEAMNADETVAATVVEVVKGGLVVKVLGSRGFMPASMIATRYVEDLNQFLNQTMDVKITEVDKTKNRIIVSHKVIEQVELKAKKAEIFANIQKGDVFEGTVKKNTNFGSFVDIGGVDGLVHINEISWKRVGHPNEVVKEGDKVTVTVINVNKEKEKIGLTMKNSEDDPWNASNEKLKVGETYDGLVKRIADFGAFVEVIDGVEGLVHVSQMSNKRVEHPSDVVKVGDTIKVRILGIDLEEKRLRLTMKEEGSETPSNSGSRKPRPRRNTNFRKDAPAKTYKSSDEEAVTTLGSLFAGLDLKIED